MEKREAAPHWRCTGRDHKNLNQNIYLSYCRDHDEILLQYEGTVILYQEEPPMPTRRNEDDTTMSHSVDQSFTSRIFQGIVFLVSLLIIIPLVFNSSGTDGINSSSSGNARDINATTTGSWALRNQYFSFQYENMRSISASIQTTTLHSIMDRLTFVMETIEERKRPACLCHHHLNYNASIQGIYAPVCIIPLGQRYWLHIVNPKPMAMDDLYRYHTDVIITRSQVDESHSFVLKPEKRQRYNTLGIYSQWPALNYTPYYQQQATRQHTILYDNAARCMALALDEIQLLLDHK